MFERLGLGGLLWSEELGLGGFLWVVELGLDLLWVVGLRLVFVRCSLVSCGS